jgi:hypothetical protein
MKEKTLKMTKLLFTTALLLGAIAVVWMSSIFFNTDALALTVTAVIGGVYCIGVTELFQFRHATSTLSQALSVAQKKVAVLDEWLDKLDPSLRNSVRVRVEGERVGLPAPVLTPYLVGLLVMLGLLGTFVGMVDTLRGAVSALEGTTELMAIRAGLAAPIKGLGLAFGTSVAGVATSAMLGLMSTLSRRDRMLETRRLDTKITTVFQEFSLVHCQRETFKALESQTRAIPEVVGKLHSIADKLESMGDKLLANQDLFHLSVKSNYSELAASVDKTLKESLTESVRLAGKNIKPVVQDAMAGITKETENLHSQLTLTTKENLKELSGLFADTSQEVTRAWKEGLEAHDHSNRALIGRMSASLNEFKEQFEHMAESMLESLNKTSSSWIKRQETSDKDRLDLWADSLEQSQKKAASHLADTSKTFSDELKQVTGIQQVSLETATRDFASMSSSLTSEWQQVGESTLAQQNKISESLEETVRELTTNVQTTTTQMHNEMTGLLKSSEDLIHARIKTEESWIKGHGERMDTLTATLRTELGVLRDDEEHRGQAATERLANLESTLASHLATIVKELEEPMTRLIQTASDAPRAASEVIEQLRHEVSKNSNRDNRLLEERKRIMEELDTLSRSLALNSTEQREAIEDLVDSSKNMIKDIGRRFTDHADSEVSKFSEIAESFAGSAVEMASLGDAFSTAVNLFNEANGNLIENLARIEESLENATSRSDDQLGYYVAQAREIIDHSMLSQREIFEELQQLRQKDVTNLEVD